jgi:hypothetical protein
MKSGIFIDDQFIGVTWHGVSVYFDVLKSAIDSGDSVRFTIPGDGGMLHYLINSHTRLRATVDAEEAGGALAESLSNNLLGNFPALARKYLDVDSLHWDLINKTSLGEEIKKLDDPIEPS